jgi:protein-S-isoprenylcysteine O-methyltransferase Ste14
MDTKKMLPPTYLLIAILLIAPLGFFFPIVQVIPPIWSLLGLIPIALGVIINLIADRAFQQAQTTVKPFEDSAAFLVDGVFRISRNPMYLGFVLILAGIAILLRGLSPWLVVVGFAILMQRIFICREEEMMAGQFGGEWDAYCKQTRRWV